MRSSRIVVQEPLELRPGQRLHDDVPVQDRLVQALRVDLEHGPRARAVDLSTRVQRTGALRAAALEPVRELGERRMSFISFLHHESQLCFSMSIERDIETMKVY